MQFGFCARPRDAIMRQVVLVFVLSALGSTALLGIWVLLNSFFWQPYWRELRNIGFYTHDVEAAFLLAVGVPAIGCLFFVGGLAEALAQAISGRESMLRTVAFYIGAPSILNRF